MATKGSQKNADKKREGLRTRNWGIVMYPDSAPRNWKNILDENLTPYFVSPLHDKDVNADGSLKKPHWHIVLMYSGVKRLEQVQPLADELHAPAPKMLNNLRGAVRYLTHRDNPEKAQYDRSQIIEGCGASYIDASEDVGDVRDIFVEIIRFVRENDIRDFDVLLDKIIEEGRMDWLYVVSEKRTLAISKYIDARWKRINNSLSKYLDKRDK